MPDNKQKTKEQTLAIARPEQFLYQHLLGVAEKAKQLAQKMNLGEFGYLIGLVHDLGKYSQEFQRYILSIANTKSIIGNLKYDEDEDAYDYKKQKGKIDHSTAGAQWIWNVFESFNTKGHGRFIAQILSVCVASHHSGLIDFTNETGRVFIKRMEKDDEKTHLSECLHSCDAEISMQMHRFESNRQEFIKQFFDTIQPIFICEKDTSVQAFYFGLLTKFLFSCLIDADRLDSAERDIEHKANWDELIVAYENNVKNFSSVGSINQVRQNISQVCLTKASTIQGVYRLTVPTGGGKTYSSLRYALHHAKKHNLDRIIYVIPFTSIIEQNADQIRKILNDEVDSKWVLEHHSNLEPEQQTWHSKLACENWDKPIVLTTMVQFLEVLFGAGTRGVRRLHQLTNSVLIFDEIQSLPIRCFHLFCNSINFLTAYAKSTVVLCTATQPSLDALQDKKKGCLNIPAKNELMGESNELDQLFDDLSRVEVENYCKTPGWEDDQVTEFVLDKFNITKSLLVIANTKSSAQKLFLACKEQVDKNAIFYLSTNLYPAHRKSRFDLVRERLEAEKPVLCISTQLIEAGVDISFKNVIRYLAGLDSIAQAAGRCNRHAEMGDQKGKVFIINPKNENLVSLEEIKIGQRISERVFRELPDLAAYYDKSEIDVLHPETIKLYFKYYFKERADEMAYPLRSNSRLSRCEIWNERPSYDTDILDLLSENETNGTKDLYKQTLDKQSLIWLRQAFKTAGRNFATIEAPTKPLIIDHGEGKKILAELCGFAKEFNPKGFYEMLRKAQRYTVNIYPNDWQQLQKVKAITEIQGEGIFYLNERHYSEEFGVSNEEVSKMSAEIF
jgi:CRISPR-associated endonuclease/helicase Cas3